jgi:hypothetical protein
MIAAMLFAAASGCATQGSQDVRSPQDRLGGMPVPDPTADRDNNDQRFGIESARERGATARQKLAERRRCADIIAGRIPNTGPPCGAPRQ